MRATLLSICLIPSLFSAHAQWFAQTSGTSEALLGTSFVSSDTGFVVGTSGTILATVDGGEIWIPQTSGTTNFLRDVFFTDDLHGIIIGESGLILRTTNTGTSWLPVASPTTVRFDFRCNCSQPSVTLSELSGLLLSSRRVTTD